MSEYAYFDYYPLITKLAKEHGAMLGRDIHYLEIGTQEGGSANAAFESGCVGLAVLIDTWGLTYGGTGKGNPDHVVSRLGHTTMKQTIIISGDSAFIVPGLRHNFDLIFVDGDHGKSGCLTDLENCLKLLEPDGILLVDDTDHPAHPYIRKIASDFAARHNLSIAYHNLQFGVAELRRTK